MVQLVAKCTCLVVEDSSESIITSNNDQSSFASNWQLKWHVHQNCMVVTQHTMECRYVWRTYQHHHADWTPGCGDHPSMCHHYANVNIEALWELEGTLTYVHKSSFSISDPKDQSSNRNCALGIRKWAERHTCICSPSMILEHWIHPPGNAPTERHMIASPPCWGATQKILHG